MKKYDYDYEKTKKIKDEYKKQEKYDKNDEKQRKLRRIT